MMRNWSANNKQILMRAQLPLQKLKCFTHMDYVCHLLSLHIFSPSCLTSKCRTRAVRSPHLFLSLGFPPQKEILLQGKWSLLPPCRWQNWVMGRGDLGHQEENGKNSCINLISRVPAQFLAPVNVSPTGFKLKTMLVNRKLPLNFDGLQYQYVLVHTQAHTYVCTQGWQAPAA